MTFNFRALLILGTLLLGILALAGVAVTVWTSLASDRENLDLAPERTSGSSDAPGADLSGRGPTLDPLAQPGVPPATADSVRPGLRTPSGLDLSDPAFRKAHLADLLARRPIPWSEVAELLALMTEPLDPAMRARLLEALKVGDRNGALQALVNAHDPAFVPELFAIVDDPGAAVGARRVALQVLGRMPAGERDALVKELEARLAGHSAPDAEVLSAIALRGGAEAMRAVSEYVLRSPDASALGQSLVGRLDVARDPAAAAVLAEALGRVQAPAALDTLVRLAGQEGAALLAASLIALDRDDQPAELRQRVFESLALTGSAEAIAHLLAVSRQPGQFGEYATLALAQLSSAAPEAREALLAELERATLNPRPELAKAALLESLGTLQVQAALPQVVSSLRDASERVRNSAVRSLGRMGPSARAHVSEIGRLFASGSEATRVVVAMSLGSIGGADAARELEELVKLPNLGPSLQRTLAYALDTARGGPDQAGVARED